MKTIISYDMNYMKKTSKFTVLGVLGIFLAGLSALTARYLNVIIEYALGQDGIDIVMPEPTVKDSYIQFFSNFNQIFLLVLLFIGVLFFIQDKTQGHYPLIFTKPIVREHYIFSKVIVVMATLIITYIVSILFFGYYTFFLFDSFDTLDFLVASLAYISLSTLILMLGLLTSVLFKSYFGAVMLPLVIFIFMGMLSFLNQGIFKYFPHQLTVYSIAYLEGDINLNTLLVSSFIGLLIATIFLYLALRLFKKVSLT